MDARNMAIGVFDSGLGGLSAVRELMNVLPCEDIVYFGDTGRVPYGSRSRETIAKYAQQDVNFLLKNNVKIIIAACGTVSSVAKDLYHTVPVPYTGVVNPTVTAAAKATKNGKVGVIGTSATINSHSYKETLCSINPHIQVFEQDCPLFVPLVENGFTNPSDIIVKSVIEHYTAELKAQGVDTLILGCTHYPLLSEAIGKVMGEGVTLIDSGRATALYTAQLLREQNLETERTDEGRYSFFVSDTPHNFESIASMFLGRDVKSLVKQIDIEQY